MTLPLCPPSHLSSEKYGLGAHNAYRNPIGKFLFELLPEPTTLTPPNALLSVLSPKLHHNQIGVTTVDVKDLRQIIAIETCYGETNAWLEWINYSIHTLNKKGCYACVTGRPEPRVVLFPLGWTTDNAGMACMIALFQERTAWGNRSCQTLSLLFPSFNDLGRSRPPKLVRPPL
jgi:hypothetical protein